MAHIGQESRFHAIRLLGLELGFLQPQLGLFQFGDIDIQADHLDIVIPLLAFDPVRATDPFPGIAVAHAQHIPEPLRPTGDGIVEKLLELGEIVGVRLDVSILDIGDRTAGIHIAVPLLGRRETVQARNPLAEADLGHFSHVVEPVFDVAQPVVRAVRFGVVHHDDHILVDIAVAVPQRSTPREQVPDFGVSAFVVSARKNFPEVVIHRELNVLPPAHRFTLFGRDVRIVEQADPERILFPPHPYHKSRCRPEWSCKGFAISPRCVAILSAPGSTR